VGFAVAGEPAAALLIGLVAVWMLVTPPMARSLNLWSLRASPRYGHEVKWTLHPDRVVMESEGIQSPMPWNDFEEVIDGADGILLVRSSSMFYWLPTAGFGDSAGRSAASELASGAAGYRTA
jgi:hypothetical protein